MALQGTIDTFPFADVLSLISSSARSGQLTLTGDRGSGSLWVDGDMILAGQLTDGRIAPPSRAVFELLRFCDGAFVFESMADGEFPEFDMAPVAIEACLATAREMLEDWQYIEAKVPSGAHRVALTAELPDPEVTVDGATWRTLVTITRCSSVGHLSLELGIDDYECSLMIAGLIDRGLVEVADPWDLDALLADGVVDLPTPGVDPGVVTAYGDEEVHAEAVDYAPVASADMDPAAAGPDAVPAGADEFPDHFPIDDLIPDTLDPSDDPWVTARVAGHTDEVASSYQTPDPDAFLNPSEPWPDDISGGSGVIGMGSRNDDAVPYDDRTQGPDEVGEAHADDVLRQMSTLSPSAAEAIAATLSADPGEVGDPAQPADESVREPRRSRRRGLFSMSRSFGVDTDGVDAEPYEEESIDQMSPGDDELAAFSPEDLEGGTAISYVDLF